jgi:environmental stress-induced protein Ves
MRLLAPSEFRSQPWKNGGGITHEIARWPDVDDYDVRISIADDRAAAPFSRFPGYRRWSFLAAAAPIELDVAGQLVTLRELGDVLEVGGDVAITCRLPDGPTRLFNILVRQGVAAQVGRGPCAAPIRFAFALAAQPWLPAGHAAVFDPATLVALDAHAVWLR